MSTHLWSSLVLAGLMACSANRSRVPSDFELVIRFEPSQPGSGPGDRTSLQRYSDDASRFVLIRQTGQIVEKIYTTQQQVEVIVQIIHRDRILKMKRSYDDPDVLDGGTTVLEIHANGHTKEIFLRNTMPMQLKNLFEAIEQIRHRK